MALTCGEIEALTQDYWDKGTHDQYFRGNVLMYRLLKKGKKYDGGRRIRVQLDYGEPHGDEFNSQSTFDTNKYEEHTSAFFKPGYIYEPVTYDIDDVVENSGDAAQVSIIDSKLSKAQKKIRSKMADKLYANTGYGVTGRGILGLPAMVSTTSTYGEIAVADLPEWVAGYSSSSAGPISFGTLRTMASSCLVGDDPMDEPTMYVTTRTLYDAIKGMTLPMQQFEDVDLADVGFKNVLFEGKPVVSDYKCPSGYVYTLNENYMDFYSHKDFFFMRTPWMRPTNAYKFTCQIIWAGQMVCKRRQAHGVHSGLTA